MTANRTNGFDFLKAEITGSGSHVFYRPNTLGLADLIIGGLEQEIALMKVYLEIIELLTRPEDVDQVINPPRAFWTRYMQLEIVQKLLSETSQVINALSSMLNNVLKNGGAYERL
jgi:hypothetical protein